MKFETILNELMEKNNISRKTLKLHLNKSNNQVLYNWLNGICKPDYTDLVKLSEIFNVSCHYLITGKEWNGLTQNKDGVYISKDELIELLRIKITVMENQKNN